MGKLNRLLTMLLTVTLAAGWSLAAGAAPLRRIDPVVIPGDQLDGLLGAPPANLAAFAFESGSWRAIVHQVDERMDVSAYQTWTTTTTVFSYAFDAGVHAQDPDPAFDRDDELVFMAASAGGQAPPGASPEGANACEEIELEDSATGERSFVYACAMRGPAPAPVESYVALNNLDYERGANRIEAAGYEVSYPPGNPVNFTSFRVRGPAGLKPNVVDRFKMGISVEIVFGIAQYPLTDADYVHFIRGVRAGPVRVIKEYESVLETFAGAQLRTYNQVIFYPYHIEYDIKARGAGNWGKKWHKSDLTLAIDLDDNGRGMTFHSQKNPDGEQVDGFTSPSEIDLDYGPTEWAAVSGEQAGTIMVHMGLGLLIDLHKDLYYSDNDDKSDPPEKTPGMIGKFGYVLRNLQYEGFDYWPLRFSVYGTPELYEPGVENEFINAYLAPLKVTIKRRQLYSLIPDAPMIADLREDRPRSIYEEKKQTVQITKFFAPAFVLDPYLLGYGPGASYSDIDFLGTGVNFWIMAMFTERGYSSYEVSFSELRFIQGVESFRVGLSARSFPVEPFYGIGDATDIDERTVYWWRENKAEVTFSKYFGNVYGADFRVGYRDVSIDSGLEPKGSDEGDPSVEERFGSPRQLDGATAWGDPVYGLDGGNLNVVAVTFYRDMRDAKNLPKFGNYQAIGVEAVSQALGADYDYAKVTIDLRGYYHPDFLNPIPYVDEKWNPRRTFLGKFIGNDKNRTIAARIVATHLIAEEVDWHGRNIKAVPFYELPYVGSSSTVKGYASKRFRDNDVVYGSIEYRWRLWRFQDAAVYYDVGTVMDDMFIADEWGDRWHSGYGVSWRLHMPPNIIVTFEYGWSDEVNGNIYQMNFGF